MMDQEIKRQWVDALRSGEYLQGRSVLCHIFPATRSGLGELIPERRTYCCLGVLCELAVKAGVLTPAQISQDDSTADDDGRMVLYADYSTYPPPVVQTWAGLTEQNPRVFTGVIGEHAGLANLNDQGSTFEQIAGWIDASL